ncbi:Histidine--tRNA ligase, partial [Fusarium oxysporum f. sp. albedinis]
MENDIPTIQVPDGRSSRRDRLMGKLFGAKDRKGEEARSAANVESFLHSSSDNLTITN